MAREGAKVVVSDVDLTLAEKTVSLLSGKIHYLNSYFNGNVTLCNFL